MAKRKTKEDFLQQSISVHGEKYDYSLVDYLNSRTKVTIVCRSHGRFEQFPYTHIDGGGCPKCALERSWNGSRKKIDDFINESRSLHGEKYDYSLVSYSCLRSKITIVCPKHGKFQQLAENHLKGKGCQSCGRQQCVDSRRKTTQDFILAAKEKHGDRYDYSLCDYLHSNINVTIICREHGLFEQSPGHHIYLGQGCPKCGLRQTGEALRSTTKEFVEKARCLHGDRYNYDLAKYVKSQAKITIICGEHGPFKQTPNRHLAGCGCPACAKYGFDSQKPGILYLVKFKKPYCTFWKIGITNKSLKERFRSDARSIEEELTWQFTDGAKAYEMEQKVLWQFKDHKIKDFLFPLLDSNGDTECFNLSLPYGAVVQFVESLLRANNLGKL